MVEVNYLKTAVSWNEYPHCIRTKTIKLLKTREKRQQKTHHQDKENLPVIFLRIPYAGAQGERLVKNLTKNLKRIIPQPFILKSRFFQIT